MQYPVGDLLQDTRVTPVPEVPGRYRGIISPGFNILYAFGGVTMACAVSAARAALQEPSFDLLSATATFLSPIPSGPVSMDVKSLRRGKGSEQLTVDLRAGEGAHSDLHVITTFGPRRDSDTSFVDLRMPDAKSPEHIAPPTPPPDYPQLKLPYHQSVDIRSVLGNPPWDTSWEGGPARWVGWYRFRNTPRNPDGLLDPLAYIPPGDMIGPALLQARGPKAPSVMVVSLEISMHFYARTAGEWMLLDTQLYQAGGGYVSGSVHLWNERGVLLAHALQRAVMRPRTF